MSGGGVGPDIAGAKVGLRWSSVHCTNHSETEDAISEFLLLCNHNMMSYKNEPAGQPLCYSSASCSSQVLAATSPTTSLSIIRNGFSNFDNAPLILTRHGKASVPRWRNRDTSSRKFQQLRRRHHSSWPRSRWRHPRLAQRLRRLLYLLWLPRIHQLLRRAAGVLRQTPAPRPDT
jgi:hypothetical protein